jgi:hypothetical protein
MNGKRIAAAAMMSMMVAGPAAAHHSFAMFDKSKEVELKDAVVVEWQWTSPHTWLYVMVPNGKGKACATPSRGQSRPDAPPGLWQRLAGGGDHITVYMSPLRSGQPGGAINAVKLPNGSMLGERLK